MSFDVLHRSLNLNTHFLVEASAGTGKTYTIEHLFVRRLLVPKENGAFVEPQEIAVLTFTRLVARELRVRIRKAIDTAISLLKEKSSLLPDYLKEVVEQKQEQMAITRLTLCKGMLETVCIGTIHSFCHAMIAEWQGLDAHDEKREASDAQLEELVDDYFRKKLEDDPIQVVQLAKVLKMHKNSFASLRSSLIEALWEERKEKKNREFAVDGISFPLESFAALFTGCATKAGEYKRELLLAMEALELYAKEQNSVEAKKRCIKHPLFASEWFHMPKVKAKSVLAEDAAHQKTYQALMDLEPAFRQLADPLEIQEALRLRVQDFVKQALEEKGLFCYKALLRTMQEKLQHEAFREFLQSRFACLIVDEFQDTDPIQWAIIKELFLCERKASLYLVGDPKQAIYAFRNADVYAYMQAKETLQAPAKALSTNYRSSPSLIHGLNCLFSGSHGKKLFYLPQLGTSIEPPHMAVGGMVREIEDGKRPIIFFEAIGSMQRKRVWPTCEVERELFGFIAAEIKALHSHGIADEACAILVRDRHQFVRLEQFLKEVGIACCSRRKRSIVDSFAVRFLKKIFKLCTSPKDKKTLTAFLLEMPFHYCEEEITCLLEDIEVWAGHVREVLALKKSFDEGGLSRFFQHFLEMRWYGCSKSIQDSLLQEENGKEVLCDLELLFDELCAEKSFEGLLFRLTSLGNEVYGRYDHLQKGVQVLTLHAAKGLEFDVVFAIGLATRSPQDATHLEDGQAEKMRLFYVAATRAKKRLYIPIATAQDRDEYNPKTIAPSELFLQKLGSLSSFVQEHQNTISHVIVTEGNKIALQEPFVHTIYAVKPRQPFVHRPHRIQITSFSMLDKESVVSKKSAVQPPFTIGTNVGIIFHAALNAVCELSCAQGAFVEKELFEACIEREIRGTALETERQQVASMLWEVFHTSLSNHTFCLADIDWETAHSEQDLLMQEVFQDAHSSFMRAVVDLAFTYKGIYYLLDWKSNWLEDGYSQETIRHAIRDHHYDMQAKMYSRAYAKQAPSFGGFFFYFIRDPKQGSLFLLPEEVL